MKAAVCRVFGQPLVIEDINIAPPRPGEVKVKVAACAICHSDIHFIEGAWGGDLPAVYGHEAAGVVEAVGAGVTRVKPGDHVLATLIRSCGHCHYCSQGNLVQCEDKFPQYDRSPLSTKDGKPVTHGLKTGAFAEYAVVDASQVVAVPKELPFASASLLACGVITGFGAVVNTAQVATGSHVVVVGTGGVGLNCIQGAALRGARTVIAVDLSDEKLAAAKKFGATHGVNPRHGDAAKTIRKITGGRSADYVFVAVGAKTAVEQAFRYMGRGGTLVVVGMPANEVKTEFETTNFAFFGQRVLGSKMGSTRLDLDVPALVDLYQQGRLKLDELVSGRFPLEKINEAIEGVTKGTALRNVIVF